MNILNEHLYLITGRRGFLSNYIEGDMELSDDTIQFKPTDGSSEVRIPFNSVDNVDMLNVVGRSKFFIKASGQNYEFHIMPPLDSYLDLFSNSRRPGASGTLYFANKSIRWRNEFTEKIPSVTKARKEVRAVFVIVGIVITLMIMFGLLYLASSILSKDG